MVITGVSAGLTLLSGIGILCAGHFSAAPRTVSQLELANAYGGLLTGFGALLVIKLIAWIRKPIYPVPARDVTARLDSRGDRAFPKETGQPQSSLIRLKRDKPLWEVLFFLAFMMFVLAFVQMATQLPAIFVLLIGGPGLAYLFVTGYARLVAVTGDASGLRAGLPITLEINSPRLPKCLRIEYEVVSQEVVEGAIRGGKTSHPLIKQIGPSYTNLTIRQIDNRASTVSFQVPAHVCPSLKCGPMELRWKFLMKISWRGRRIHTNNWTIPLKPVSGVEAQAISRVVSQSYSGVIPHKQRDRKGEFILRLLLPEQPWRVGQAIHGTARLECAQSWVCKSAKMVLICRADTNDNDHYHSTRHFFEEVVISESLLAAPGANVGPVHEQSFALDLPINSFSYDGDLFCVNFWLGVHVRGKAITGTWMIPVQVVAA